MKAYINFGYGGGSTTYAEVVTSQDYHERGPFAHSYRSPMLPNQVAAYEDAIKYCDKNKLQVVPVDEI